MKYYKIIICIIIAAILSFILLILYLLGPYGPVYIVPLPGIYDYTDLYYDHGTINKDKNIIPTKISGLWWNNKYIIAESEDTAKNRIWYILDLDKSKKTVCSSYEDYGKTLKQISLSQDDIIFYKDFEIRNKREKELGFILNNINFHKYLVNIKKQIREKMNKDEAAMTVSSESNNHEGVQRTQPTTAPQK